MRDAGVQWIVSTHPKTRRHKRYYRPIRFQRRANRRLIPFTTVSLRFRLAMRKKCGPTNTGILAMAHLLRYKIKSLHVTGFSFFSTKYAEYPGYRKISPKMAFRWHDQRRHKRYVIRLLAREKRLTVDPAMTRILMKFRWKSRPAERTQIRRTLRTRRRLHAFRRRRYVRSRRARARIRSRYRSRAQTSHRRYRSRIARR